MLIFLQSHPLVFGTVLIMFDLALWQLLGEGQRTLRTYTRLLVFAAFCWVMMAAGISPLQPPLWPDDAILNLMATVLGVAWWLFAARTLTVIMGHGLMSRAGHTARLFHDLIGAVVFLLAVVGAAAYVLQLPVKGLLATSGVAAIVVGLALQSTLSDVFSGIVLNTTKPYQLDDWISIEGVEGKVMEIDWRSTHLLTEQGSMAVIPNSLAAKAKLLNFSKPGNLHRVSITLAIPSSVRPRQALDALEKALRGTRALLPGRQARVSVKASYLEYTEYELKGFIESRSHKTEVCNLMFDLAHRHLEASGITLGSSPAVQAWTRQRQLLEEVRVFRSLSLDDRDRLSVRMTPVDYQANQVILGFQDVADSLMVISTGVVSVSIHDSERFIEAGRLGPGEVIGEEGILGDGPSRGEFRCLTSVRLYRIEKSMFDNELEHFRELYVALDSLQHQREDIRESVVLKVPVLIRKSGFLSWLQNR